MPPAIFACSKAVGSLILQPIWPLIKLVLVAVIGLALVDLILFRTGLYATWIEPYSSAGSVVGSTMLIKRETKTDSRNILVLGNSTIGEGFSGPLADQAAGRPDLHFINAGVAGSTPRIWYYLLRELDPNCRRYAAVALMVNYDPTVDQEDRGNYAADTSYLQPLLRFTDFSEYSESFSNPNERERARRAIALPMQALHEDITALLRSPLQRFRDSGRGRRLWMEASINYPGRDQRLPDLDIDVAAGKPRNWGGVPASTKTALEGYFRGLRQHASEQTIAANNAYVDRWIGSIAECYHAAGGKVFVFSMSRGPWHELLVPAPQIGGAVADLTRRGLIEPLPAANFVPLEQPRYFFDTLHMNHDGRERFSRLLAAQIAARMH